jgi:hypothetical protein
MHSRHENACQGETVELFDKVKHEPGMSASPTVRENLSAADIRRNNNTSGKRRAHVCEPVGIFECSRTNDDSLSAVVQKPVDRIPASYAATDLNLGVSCRKNRADLIAVVSPSCHSVQVDDV